MGASKAQIAELQSHVERWRREGPARFAQDILDATPTDQQWEASRKLVERRRISIRSGHGTGKSTFEAWAILWFASCYFPCKIPVTAPTSHQLSDILWAELTKWHRVLRERSPWLGNQFECKSDLFEMKSHPKESFAVARTSRAEQPEALQGFHSEHVLFVIDEASGVPEPVFEVAEGALSTAGAFVIMAGNPTRMEGYFYESHHKMRGSWAALHWNSEDSPLVSPDYLAEMKKKYGEDSAIYKIRVKGEFAGTPDGVIPLDIIQAAQGRDVKPHGDEIWGVDVARFGDDRTALAKRRKNAMDVPVKSWAKRDTMETAGYIAIEYEQAKVKPVSINVDVIGLGAGVVDRLKELRLPVRGINVAEVPSARAEYNKLRDELWFEAREWFYGRDVRMCDDDALVAELTLPTFRVLSSGKKQVESKDDMKKRGVTSPDLADAFCLTFARGIPGSADKPIKYDNRGIV